MTTGAPQPLPDPDPAFTPDPGAADLAADPATGRGPGGSPIPGSDADDGPGLGSPEKDPEDWVTGDEPMTGAQRSYLDTLAREAGEQLSPDLTKAEASEHIDRLQEKTGRGSD